MGLIGSFLGVKESGVLAPAVKPRIDFEAFTKTSWEFGPKGIGELTPVEDVIRLSCLDSWGQRSQLSWYPEDRHKNAARLASGQLGRFTTFDSYYGAINGLWLADGDAYTNKMMCCILASIADKKFNLKERYRRGEIT